MIDRFKTNYIFYIKLIMVYSLVYISTVYMLYSLGVNIYLIAGMAIIISFFIHDTLYKNSAIVKDTENYNDIAFEAEINTLRVKKKTTINKTISLNELVGLQSVKDNISDILNLVKVETKRGNKPIIGHYIFQGNPGTGKTTVGRILGQTFKNMKFLSNGNFVEDTRDDLVGQY